MAIGRFRTGHKIGRRRAEREYSGPQNDEPVSFEDGETARRKLMARAVRLLARRSMSENQIRERLASSEDADPAHIDAVVQSLKERGFLNDRKFGESYAAYRRSKPIGRSRMAKELAVRGLAKGDIDPALDAVYSPGTDEELIDKAIAKHVRTKGEPSGDAEIRRLFAYLARLGFDYDLISSKVRTLRRKT